MRTKTKTTITSLAAGLASLALAPSAFAGPAKPVKATALKVSAPATATAGTPFDATVTAVTKQGKRVKDFRGRVALAAGAGASVPGAHAFSRTDGGRYVFQGIELPGSGQATVTASSGKLRGSDTVAVAAGQIATIELTAPARVDAGQPFEAHVSAKDAKGNPLGDQTAQATLTMAGAECSAGTCTATRAGAQTLSARVGGVADEAGVEVAPGAASRLEVSADNARHVIPARIQVAHGSISTRNDADVDEARRYSARAFDAYGNDLGEVTSQASFTVGSSDCQGAVCKGTTPGTQTVTARMGSATGSSQMQVASYEDTYTMWCQQKALPGDFMGSAPHFLDMDGQIANGCEVENELVDIYHRAGARDLGEKSCHDGASKIDESVTLLRDGRGNRASAYFKVKATGGWTCINDTVLDVEVSGGQTEDKCFRIGTWFGGVNSERTEGDVLMGGDEKVRLANGNWYQSGMDVYFKVQQVCGQGAASPQVRITGHL